MMRNRADQPPPFDPLAIVAGANPVPADEVTRTAEGDAIKAALFKEITMSGTTTIRPIEDRAQRGSSGPLRSTSPSRSRERSRTPKRRWLVPATAAAGIAVAVAAAVAVSTVRSTDPAAALSAAAEQTAAARSGHVEIVAAQIGGAEAVNVTISTDYYDTNFDTTVSDGDPTSGTPDEVSRSRFVVVDGVMYIAPAANASLGDPGWSSTEASAGQGLPLGVVSDPVGATGGLVRLMRAADNVREVSADHYTATVTVGELRSLGTLPGGLEILTTDPPIGAPIPVDEEVMLEAEVDGAGYLRTLVARVDDSLVGTETVPVDATVTTTYSALGRGAPIAAPTSATPLPTGTVDPAEEAAMATLNDLDQRRPDLCPDVPSDDVPAYVACLRAGGEDEAADAYQLLFGSDSSAGPGTTEPGGNGG